MSTRTATEISGQPLFEEYELQFLAEAVGCKELSTGARDDVQRAILEVADALRLRAKAAALRSTADIAKARQELLDVDLQERLNQTGAKDPNPALLNALVRLASVATWDEDSDRPEFDAAMREARAAVAATGKSLDEYANV